MSPQTVLPRWVGYAGIVFPIAALVMSYVTTALLIRVAGIGHRVPAAAETWVERARLTFPARRVAALNALLQMPVWANIAMVYGNAVSRLPMSVVAFASGMLACCGALRARYGFEKRLRSDLPTFAFWLRGQLAVLLFATFPFVFFVLLALLLPPYMPGRIALLLTAAVGTTLATGLGAGVPFCRLLGLARPASDRLRQIVQEAMARTGVSLRSCFELRTDIANAFALPLAHSIGVTSGALSLLSDEELTLICCHELGHVTELKRRSLVRLLLVAYLLAPIVFQFELHQFAFFLAALAVAVILWRRISRRGEAAADEYAHRAERNPSDYARALEKLYQHNLVPVVLAKKGTSHPHLYDRMVAAGLTPAYPRPAPPPRSLLALATMGAIAAVLSLAPWRAHVFVRRYWPASERCHRVSLSLLGGNSWELGELGAAYYMRQEYAEASTLYGSASGLREQSAFYPAMQSLSLVGARRCDEAKRAASIAHGRLSGATSSYDRIDDKWLAQVDQSVETCR